MMHGTRETGYVPPVLACLGGPRSLHPFWRADPARRFPAAFFSCAGTGNLVITGAGRGSALMQWGLVPHLQRPVLRTRPFMPGQRACGKTPVPRSRRPGCLVPATGFFEWRARKVAVVLPDAGRFPVCVCRAYDRWQVRREQRSPRFDVLTTEPTRSCRGHKRMPV